MNKIFKQKLSMLMLILITYNCSTALASERLNDIKDIVYIVGDPQFYRVAGNADPNKYNKQSIEDNAYSIISIVNNGLPLGISPSTFRVIVNGDLTEYGFAGQLSYYKERYGHPGVWPGLGNHDYSNNVNDTYENRNAIRMIKYMSTWLSNNANSGYDWADNYGWGNSGEGKGSMSYTKDVGNYRFIQLNYFPDYKREFGGWYWSGADANFLLREPGYKKVIIQSSIDNGWLDKELKKAKRENKKVVLNMHYTHDQSNPEGRRKLDNLLKQYNHIKAIFIGHIHHKLGNCSDGVGKSIGNNVPIYFSGSPMYKSYLTLKITSSDDMVVERFRHVGNGGNNRGYLGRAEGVCDSF